MAVLGVDDFKSKLIGGGARSNLFKATINFPAYAQGDTETTSFLCKSAALPGSTITATEINFRGRILKIAGDRTFENWSITILNDSGLEIRNAMERWMNGISEHAANTGIVNPTEYQTDLVMEQLDKAGNVTKTYDIRGAFPVNVAQLEMAYDSEGISETTVEFAYQYWESNTTT